MPFSYSPDPNASGWEPFDPSADALPESLVSFGVPPGDRGWVVAVAVAAAPTDQDWIDQACFRVAEMFVRTAERSLLIDLELGRPTLHKAMGLSNDGGIGDGFVSSPSLEGAATPVPGRGFLFVPASGGVRDRGGVLEHASWGTLLPGLTRKRTTVVLHLPLAAPGAESMLARADAAVLLGRPTDLLAVLVEGFHGPVAWLGPPSPELDEPIRRPILRLTLRPKTEEQRDVAPPPPIEPGPRPSVGDRPAGRSPSPDDAEALIDSVFSDVLPETSESVPAEPGSMPEPAATDDLESRADDLASWAKDIERTVDGTVPYPWSGPRTPAAEDPPETAAAESNEPVLPEPLPEAPAPEPAAPHPPLDDLFVEESSSAIDAVFAEAVTPSSEDAPGTDETSLGHGPQDDIRDTVWAEIDPFEVPEAAERAHSLVEEDAANGPNGEEVPAAPALTSLEAEFEGLPTVDDTPPPRRRAVSPAAIGAVALIAVVGLAGLVVANRPDPARSPTTEASGGVPADPDAARGADPQSGDPLRALGGGAVLRPQQTGPADPTDGVESGPAAEAGGDAVLTAQGAEAEPPDPSDERGSTQADPPAAAEAQVPVVDAVEPGEPVASEDPPELADVDRRPPDPDPVPPTSNDPAPGPRPAATSDAEPSVRRAFAPEAPPPGEGPSGPMAFGVVVGRHATLTAARSQASALEVRIEGVLFTVVPVDEGSLVYQVVAGSSPTQDHAESVRAALVDAAGVAGSSQGVVRSTRWAFLLGVHEDWGEAVGRVESLESLGIPAYLVEIPVGEDRILYRVYSGAFASEAEAVALGAILQEAGVGPPRLTERVGRPVR